MALTFTLDLEQYDGEANNADPTDGPPTRYSGNQFGSTSDVASSATSWPGPTDGLHILRGEAVAMTGQNAVGRATAHSFNKIRHVAQRQLSFAQRILERFGLRRPMLTTLVIMNPTSDVGPSTVRQIVWIRDANGRMVVNFQRFYEFAPLAGNPPRIRISRNGTHWRTVADNAMVHDDEDLRNLWMPVGTYTFQSELNVTAEADGRVSNHVLTLADIGEM